MSKETKLTLDELIRRKEQILAQKEMKKKAELYVESLDAVITVTAPDRETVSDVLDMPTYEQSSYLAYQCITEPSMKAAAKEFGCDIPMNVIDIIFTPGEVEQIAKLTLELAGYKEGQVTQVDAIKN